MAWDRLLLLIHGGLDNAFSWAPILPALARGRRVIAVDLPGHGLADPFDFAGVDLLDHGRIFLREILDALDLPSVDMVASSIGALYAVAFALSSPERVSRLVLVGAPAGSRRPGVPLQLRLLALPLVGRRLGRMLMSNPTRDGNRKFWGRVLVAHPENLDDAHLDADVASQRRNIDTHLSLISCVADTGGVRKHLILGGLRGCPSNTDRNVRPACSSSFGPSRLRSAAASTALSPSRRVASWPSVPSTDVPASSSSSDGDAVAAGGRRRASKAAMPSSSPPARRPGRGRSRDYYDPG